ncbi:SDR family NAD(P)-dependent oxidoreductase [Streptomyces sp. NPDC002577]
MQLEGKRIIVTGGAMGMGAATVRAYVREGAQVASFDIKDDEAAHVVEMANESGPGSAKFFHCDVSRRDSVDSVVDKAVEDLGGLDVFVDVAGAQRRKPAHQFTDDDIEFVIGANLRGTILTNQAAFRHLDKEKGGVILNFGSSAGMLGMPGIGVYSAAKGGVMAWTRSVAAEWGRYNIRVNCIEPAISTPMTDSGKAEGRGDLYAGVILGQKLGDPDTDFAPVMVFMAGDGAKFITGQTISVNGGIAMVR